MRTNEQMNFMSGLMCVTETKINTRARMLVE